MTDPAAEPRPEIKPASRFNKVWIIPIVAVLLGAWLVKRTAEERGEIVRIRFETAEGLSANKTEVRCRNVVIGTVTDIKLTDSLEVDVFCRIKPDHLHLVREQSQFWVEKARLQGASVTGLGTIIGGAFVQLDPGEENEDEDKSKREFVGLETPPITPSTVDGLRIFLTTKAPGSVDVGSIIHFQENPIGKVESRVFDTETKTVEFGLFIEQDFRTLVTENCLFWQGSGIKFEVRPEGFDLDLPSLNSLVAGRIAMNVPEGIESGEPVSDGRRFTLHESFQIAQTSTFQGGVSFVILLDQSLRGLRKGSPVEYRGLKVGRVGRISYDLVPDVDIRKIPVLIQLDSRLMATHFPPSIMDEGEDGFSKALDSGLRASLKAGNLLTGQLYVDLDYYPDLPPASITQRGEHIILPTIETGLESIQDQVAALLDKMNALDVEGLIAKTSDTSEEATRVLSSLNLAMRSNKGVVADAQKTLQEMTDTMTAMKAILQADNTKAITGDVRATLAQVNESLKPLSADGAIYGDLVRTMDELRSVVRSIERMTTEIADKPNSLLFGKDPSSKKIPRARRRR